MVDQDIRTSSIAVVNGDLSIDAYLAEPVGAGSFPAVVVIQEIFGVNAHIRDVTERLAKAGYVAIAPALYQRQAPGFEAGYTPEDIQLGRAYKEQTQASELLGDIQGAIAHLQQLSTVKPDAIGCIGFCFGGHVAYLAATLPQIKATASFYGAGIPTWIPGGGAPTITQTCKIHGTLYAFFGLDDASIPPNHIDQIEAELQKQQVSHRVFRYPAAAHGFFCDRRSSYHAKAATDAWKQVQELFQTTL
ncbi:dienelactone hydrolase family protein [Oculatella sp. LEGE 06141]|nr:dienelactone hydrolase family protein [Oculatella sp. LEGE 06141]MBE9177722.1 dienelactone hydrolase family protein [Oculatella sp. LEGE 06141]